MFSRGAVLALILLVMAAAALRSAPLLLFGAVVGLLGLVAWAGERYCLHKVSYTRRPRVRRAFFGETVELECRATNDKPLPVPWLEVLDEVPEVLLRPGEPAQRPCYKAQRAYLEMFVSLRWFERVTRRFQLHCAARGDFRLGPARLEAGDVFGLYQRTAEAAGEERLIVYPRLVPVAGPPLPGGRPQGDRRARRWILEDPLWAAGVRDYAPGDPFRLIHWKATARAGRLQVKACEPTSSLQLMLAANVNTSPRPWEGYHPEILELVLMLAAALARDAMEGGCQVGLLANSCLPGTGRSVRLPPGRDPRQLREILTVLAQAAYPAAVAPEQALAAEARLLRWGASLVLITAYLHHPLAMALAALRAGGHPVAVVLVGDRPGPFSAPAPPGAAAGAGAPWLGAAEDDGAAEERAAVAQALRGIRLWRLRREGSWRDISRLALEELSGTNVR